VALFGAERVLLTPTAASPPRRHAIASAGVAEAKLAALVQRPS